MSIDKQLITIAENQQKVYNAGYEKGKAEGSGGIDYDAFWDNFQGGDGRVSYNQAFSYNRFSDETYNPKYNIIASSGSMTARNMYYNNTLITDTKKPIDATSAGDIQQAFYGASKLQTIIELKVKDSHTYSSTFVGCSSLKNITITGTIGSTISFYASPLTRDSIMSIYNALSTTTTGMTCTFKKTAINNAFTDEEWKTLTDAKSNWTFTLQ